MIYNENHIKSSTLYLHQLNLVHQKYTKHQICSNEYICFHL